MSGRWGSFDLILYTKEQLKALPDGTLVISIFGEPRIKDEHIDGDTRGGYTAYGYLEEID